MLLGMISKKGGAETSLLFLIGNLGFRKALQLEKVIIGKKKRKFHETKGRKKSRTVKAWCIKLRKKQEQKDRE